jgi:hypothetical protein
MLLGEVDPVAVVTADLKGAADHYGITGGTRQRPGAAGAGVHRGPSWAISVESPEYPFRLKPVIWLRTRSIFETTCCCSVVRLRSWVCSFLSLVHTHVCSLTVMARNSTKSAFACSWWSHDGALPALRPAYVC